MKKNIAVFSSGRGGNFENICNYFHNDKSVFVCLHVTNRIDCISKKIADKRKIKTVLVAKKELENASFCEVLVENNIHLIVLAGFLLKIPSYLVNSYNRKIINLHPSLLPKFGGKGMYGDNVHLKVLESGEKKTGITIHYVNEEYDSGDIIFQTEIELSDGESLETLREKIREIEYCFFPRVIKNLL
tara:strand:+ start:13635 stop:14195 length:561 start_codon:yes stop_codon:yes gene_type:complete